jgi:hypothetical protein
MGPSVDRRPVAGRAVAGVALCALIGLAGCGAGTGGAFPSTGPAAGMTRTRTPAARAPTADRAPAEVTPSPSWEPERLPAATPAQTPAGTPVDAPARTVPAAPPTEVPAAPPVQITLAPPPPAPTAATAPTAAPTPPLTAAANPSATSTDSGGLGTFGWILVLILIVVAVVAALALRRSRHRSTWDEAARVLEADTLAAPERIPNVLATDVAAQRGLMWPPVRASLAELMYRWAQLAQQAPDEPRQSWAFQIQALVEALVSAVDVESAAVASGQDWLRLRPDVNNAERALAAALTQPASMAPPVADQPGTPPGRP